LERAVKTGVYRIPGHPDLHRHELSGASGASDAWAVQKPTEPQGFKHTAPRDKSLCFKQEVLTAWETIPDADVLAKFKDLVAKHNAKFNASGVPFKSRRPLDPDPETEIPAEPLRPRDGQYPDLAALKARGANSRVVC
jgi:hypothetical protein